MRARSLKSTQTWAHTHYSYFKDRVGQGFCPWSEVEFYPKKSREEFAEVTVNVSEIGNPVKAVFSRIFAPCSGRHPKIQHHVGKSVRTAGRPGRTSPERLHQGPGRGPVPGVVPVDPEQAFAAGSALRPERRRQGDETGS